jgi:hypothetical protein
MMRKAIRAALLIGLPLLSGCGSLDEILGLDDAAARDEHLRQRQVQLSKDIEACGPTRGTSHVAYALCVNAAFQSTMIEVAFPYPDLVATLSAERLRVAEQIDKAQISDIEGLARIDDKTAEVIRMAQTRTTSFGQKPHTPTPELFLQWLQVRV